jgi:predicted RNA methylase
MSVSMDARLQRRVQRYGWDRAVDAYARHWHGPLAGVHAEVLAMAAVSAGESVLDLACGTGVVTVAAAGRHPTGTRVGHRYRRRDGAVRRGSAARGLGLAQARFERMDAERWRCPMPASTSRCARWV